MPKIKTDFFDNRSFKALLAATLFSTLVLNLIIFTEAKAAIQPAINYFILETDGGTLLHPNDPEVSITRAQCRQRDRGIELQVLGAVHTPANATISIKDAENGTIFIPDNPATGIPADINSPIGIYNFSLGNNEAFLICPNKIVASLTNNPNIIAESDVDVRIDNAPVGPVIGLATELEGPISSIIDNHDGTATVTAMGIKILVTPTTTIHTPTVNLTVAQLVDPSPLPNRLSPGFIGGTTITLGTSNASGTLVIADDFFVEPSENVVRGIVTAANCSNIQCNGANDFLKLLGSPLSIITDVRMLAEPPKNSFGFEIDMSKGGLIGSFVAIEGYYSEIPPNNQNDQIAPIITLSGPNSLTIDLGETYVDPGVSAIDNIDGTVSVIINNPVNTNIAGTYTVTYTAQDSAGNTSTATRIVNVIPTIIINTITINPASTTIAPSGILQLTASAKDQNGLPIINPLIDWSTSDPAIATISPSGLVTGIAAGTITITATANSTPAIFNTATITVANIPVCQTGADVDGNGRISNSEILTYINAWRNGSITNQLIQQATNLWRAGAGC